VIPRDDIDRRCALLRSLHVPGRPLVLPNAWDVPSARAVVAAGFPVVATTSGGVAASLGYGDHHGAPAAQMLAAAARIAAGVDVPVSVDAEAGYDLEPEALVETLHGLGAAGCNLEDTDHAAGRRRDPRRQAEWLARVRRAAAERGYGLVINARIDVFLASALSGASPGAQASLVDEGLERARAYLDAGADCVFPIGLWEDEALARFVAEAPGPVNVLRIPPAPPLARLSELGVARISYGTLLHRDAMQAVDRLLAAVERPS